MSELLDRFIRYAGLDTQSSEDSGMHPSTHKQKVLGHMLADGLEKIGASDVYQDEYNYVYATIPATDDGEYDKVIGFISHMDTSPEASGENVVVKTTENYDGGIISLADDGSVALDPAVFPQLKNYVGKTILHTNGKTLLGADDKAGIAEIMTMASTLMRDIESGNPKIKHGKIAIAFTPDEEIGEGTEYFNLERFGADYAYTVDGGAIGELEYENFNAASATVTINGVSIHPGDAKDKMINAASIACDFQQLIPVCERPETTEGYEGFYHLTNISGDVTTATLSYIIRDHDSEKFVERKRFIMDKVTEINKKYDQNVAFVNIKDQYRNMKSVIDPDNMFVVERAANAMRKNGVEPIVKPIRGGTDGATLSHKGLPCPNICTGGHNFHGVHEYIPLESMEKVVDILLSIVTGE